MTEAEWLACNDPDPMLEFLRDKSSDRKLRLFACACCRALSAVSDSDVCEAVQVAEQYADGLITPEERQAAASAIEPKVAYFVDLAGFVAAAASATLWPDAHEGAKHATRIIIDIEDTGCQEMNGSREYCSDVLRCVFGPLCFRQVLFKGAWRTPHVEALAECIYEQQAFDRLFLLADALEEAGCDNAAILKHCRRPRPHVRGCWVVDLLLGKE
jgi:hypothetical protein